MRRDHAGYMLILETSSWYRGQFQALCLVDQSNVCETVKGGVKQRRVKVACRGSCVNRDDIASRFSKGPIVEIIPSLCTYVYSECEVVKICLREVYRRLALTCLRKLQDDRTQNPPTESTSATIVEHTSSTISPLHCFSLLRLWEIGQSRCIKSYSTRHNQLALSVQLRPDDSPFRLYETFSPDTTLMLIDCRHECFGCGTKYGR